MNATLTIGDKFDHFKVAEVLNVNAGMGSLAKVKTKSDEFYYLKCCESKDHKDKQRFLAHGADVANT